MPRRSARSSSTVTVKVAQKGNKNRRSRRQTTARQSRPRILSSRSVSRRDVPSHSLQSYLGTLQDPWSCPPVRLGWGDFTPSSLHTAFLRTSITPVSTNRSLALVCCPQFFVLPASISQNGFLTSYSSDTGSTVIGAAATVMNQGATNASVLTPAVQTMRLVSSAMRVTVRTAPTALRGTVAGLFIPNELKTNVSGFTFDALGGLGFSRYAHSNAAGETVVEIQYRPSGPADFSFYGYLSNSAATALSTVVLTGFTPGTFVVDVEIIAHYETQSGVDSDLDYSIGESLSASGVSMDIAGAAASRIQPVVTSFDAIVALDQALENVNRSMSRTGMSMRGSLGAFGQQSDTHALPVGVPDASHPSSFQESKEPYSGLTSGFQTPSFIGTPLGHPLLRR